MILYLRIFLSLSLTHPSAYSLPLFSFIVTHRLNIATLTDTLTYSPTPSLPPRIPTPSPPSPNGNPPSPPNNLPPPLPLRQCLLDTDTSTNSTLTPTPTNKPTNLLPLNPQPPLPPSRHHRTHTHLPTPVTTIIDSDGVTTTTADDNSPPPLAMTARVSRRGRVEHPFAGGGEGGA